MLFLLTILVVAAVVASIAVLLKTQKNRQTLSTNNPKEFELPEYRSLFEPSAEEIRAFELQEKENIEIKKLEEEARIFSEKADKMLEFQKVWQELPNRKNTVELVYLASQLEDGNTYFRVVSGILEFWKEGKLVDLSAENLADILESHFWLIPSEQRTSGVKFGLHQEIAGLRRKFAKTK